ncbi:MAG: ABC transporter ATP-binding protein [Chitinivibrionales bacterium]
MNDSNDAPMLQVKNLNKYFGNVHAVNSVSFEVGKGEILGFLGPNGAGKTTAMRMITGFIPPTSGEIKILGKDNSEYKIETRKKIGYLPENNPLYNEMKVREYLKFTAAIHNLPKSKREAAVDRMITICGLSQMANREIAKLSKGYKQRVGLAQAMIHDPDILILDEPMSGLDPNQIIEIRELIKNLGAEKSVIYCSHILSEVSATCSRVLIINQGAIVASGTTEELIQSSGDTCYVMTAKGPEQEIKEKFEQIEHVENVSIDERLSSENLRLRVYSSAQENMGEDLFRCIPENGWSLSELRMERRSLEDVFTKLTRS